ncbi:UNVERIFIED_CONTAM: hypothetical protein Sindi_2060000 [Sesamum indicum]
MATTEFSNEATSRGIFDPEFMQLQSSDHPGMVMVSTLLTGSNYFAWSRAVKRALTAKMKVDCIDLTATRPATNTDEFKRWNCIDSMAHFGESNSPMIYQLQREIGQVTQAPAPKCVCTGCTCGVNKAMADMSASNHLIQFLVGMNNVYEQARSQILLLEPLPTGIQRIHVLSYMGIPEWYKDMAEQKKKTGGRGRGYSALMTNESGMKVAENNYPNLTELVRLEMRKLMNDETPSDPLSINFAQLDNFASSSATSASVIFSTWIIDSGATNHSCADIHFFNSHTKLVDPLIIHLPNGHTQKVFHIGSIQLTPEIKLDHVLHILEFSDLKTEKVLATTYLLKNLYILESKLVSELVVL